MPSCGFLFSRPLMPSIGFSDAFDSFVGNNRGVRNIFDQPVAERRGGNAKHQVTASILGLEVGLLESAAGRIPAAADRKQIVDAAIRAAIGIDDEPHFTYRAGALQKRREEVPAAGDQGALE